MTDSEAAQLHNGQTRMAYRMAVLYRDKLLHVHSVGWHYWDGKRWAEDDKGKAKRAVLATFRQALRESVDMDEAGRSILRKDVRKCESGAAFIGVLGIAMALEAFAVTVRGPRRGPVPTQLRQRHPGPAHHGATATRPGRPDHQSHHGRV